MKITNEYCSPPSFLIIREFNTYTKRLLENCEAINICLVVSYQWLMPWTLSIFQNYPPFSLQAFQCLAHPHPGKLPAVTHFLHLIAAPKMISQQYYLAWVSKAKNPCVYNCNLVVPFATENLNLKGILTIITCSNNVVGL